MRRAFVVLLFILIATLLAAQVKIEKITVNGSNPIATRVVIALSEKTEWSYQPDTDKHTVKVTIYNCQSPTPLVTGLSTSTLVKQISASEEKPHRTVTITLAEQFFIEKLSLDNPYRIVIDLFKAKRNYSYEELLAQAEFYVKNDKLPFAEIEYARMLRKYLQNKDTNFLWAKLLLIQSKYNEAYSRLKLLPAESQYYDVSQKMMQLLEVKDYDALDKLLNPTSAKPSVTIADTISDVKAAPASETSSSGCIWLDSCGYLSLHRCGLPLWGWLIILLMMFIAVLIILDAVHQHRVRKAAQSKEDIALLKNDALKLEMVRKLMASGWNANEIARELMIAVKEVRQLVKQAENNTPDEDN